MKVRAKKELTHEGRTRKPGEVFDVPDAHGMDLIRQGHADRYEEGAGQTAPGSETPGGGSSGTPHR